MNEKPETRVISFGCGFGKQVPFFHLRAISVGEEDAFVAACAELKDLDDEKRDQRETEICIDRLAAWSVKPLTKKDGEEEFFSEELTAADSVRRFFDESPDKSRLARTAMGVYRPLLEPTVVFQ